MLVNKLQMLRRKIRKFISVVLILMLVFRYQTVGIVWAQEVPTEPPAPTPTETQPQDTPTPVPEPTTQTTVQDSATVEDNVDSTASTGNNTIDNIASPTPTPAPTEGITEENILTETTITPTPGEVSVDSTLTPTPSPEVTPETSLDTGGAASVTGLENTVNSSSVNSEISNSTTNISSPVTGNVDVSGGAPMSVPTISSTPTNEGQAATGQVDVSNNNTEIVNDISTMACTGDNTLEATGSAQLTTGDAFAATTVVNNVDTTLIDSILKIFTINIFSSVDGNIILPEFDLASLINCCAGSVAVENSASVENNVDSVANTGDNTLTASGSAVITTGDAVSKVNILNLINQTLVDTSLQKIWINVFGVWDGSFLGWGELEALLGGSDIVITNINPGTGSDTNCPDCLNNADIANSAVVINNINSLADTGGNQMQAENGLIKTGNAFSAVNIVNMINTTFIRSLGIFGFINIFGSLEGNIGGASKFITPTPVPEMQGEQVTLQTESQPAPREDGGQLTLSQSHNVGEYVLPGDTVTFFLTIGNSGNGKVYDTKLFISLIKDGVDTGGILYDIGNIKANGTVKVTTGLVLSKDAVAGVYKAHAVVVGYVGSDNREVSAFADSYFRIFRQFLPVANVVEEVQAKEPEQVLGESDSVEVADASLDDRLKYTLLWLCFAVLGLKAVKNREGIEHLAGKAKKNLNKISLFNF